jgi:hypothetical protein
MPFTLKGKDIELCQKLPSANLILQHQTNQSILNYPFSMSNHENRFFEQLKKVVLILIIVAVIYSWFLWCKEEPIWFLYSIIIFIVFYFLSHVNGHHY